VPDTGAPYFLRYPSLTDAPSGPALGENLAEDVHTELARIDAVIESTTTATYTPAWTMSAVGSSTTTGYYAVSGNLCTVSVTFNAGAGVSLGTGFLLVSLPIAALSTVGDHYWVGGGGFISGPFYPVYPVVSDGGSTMNIFAIDYSVGGNPKPFTSPGSAGFPLSSGHKIVASVTYEI
jgi:hypothetical protein